MTWGRAQVWGDGQALNDAIVTSTSAANVVPNAATFTSNTVSVRFRFPGAAIAVTWNNTLIRVGQILHLTNLNQTRVRLGYTAVASDGSAVLSRSSGSTPDEEMVATIVGATG